VLDKNVLDTYIVFSDNSDDNARILLPRFVSKRKNNGKSQIERIKEFQERLISAKYDSDSWQKVIKYFNVCDEYRVPYSTFDYLRAAASTPELFSKMFVLLAMHKTEDSFIQNVCPRIEEDLGYSFHWISPEAWKNAIKWIKDSLLNSYKEETISIILNNVEEKIRELYKNTPSIDRFKSIDEILFDGKNIVLQTDHINTLINRLKSKLGVLVLNSMPSLCPYLPGEYRNIFPVRRNDYKIKIMLQAPVAVAVSMLDKDNSLWSLEDDSEIRRRNVQFAQWLEPDWYGFAIIFSINKIKQNI
jgi:hypothetical protein